MDEANGIRESCSLYYNIYYYQGLDIYNKNKWLNKLILLIPKYTNEA